MAGQQFGLAIRHRTTKVVVQKIWFPLERSRDEAMATTKLDPDDEFSLEAKDCTFNSDAKPGEWSVK